MLNKAILSKDVARVRKLVHTEDLNALDRYGCTPLVHAAIIAHPQILKIILDAHANPNIKDHMECSPLYWAVDSGNMECVKLLLEHKADPNAYNGAGQPILLYPIIRGDMTMQTLLVKHGAIMQFAEDYIESKLLAHVFELQGKADVIHPDGTFVEVDAEGFLLEFSLKQVYRTLKDFMNHRDGQKMRHHFDAVNHILPALESANVLRTYKHRLADKEEGGRFIKNLPSLALLPLTFEGHATCAVTYGPYFLYCDRGESKFYVDNITIYKYETEKFTQALKEKLFLDIFPRSFIESEIPIRLGFKKQGSINIPGQVAGNCSWANVEASVLSLLTLYYTIEDKSLSSGQAKAYEFYTAWLNWVKDITLGFFIGNFTESNPARKAAIANLAGLVLFQALKPNNPQDVARAKKILPLITDGPYRYILESYAKVVKDDRARSARADTIALLKMLGVNLGAYL